MTDAMAQTWLVDQRGTVTALPTQAIAAATDRPYRLYRFLTEIEDILTTIVQPEAQLAAIVPRVRRLLSESWIKQLMIEPDPTTGWEVITLYDEPGFPLTVQLVAWAPGRQSPIHNHGGWALVALLEGQERNQFWQRSPLPDRPDHIESTETQLLQAGEIITFLPEAIHQITALGDRPTISFNLYGEPDYNQRFEFDLNHDRAISF